MTPDSTFRKCLNCLTTSNILQTFTSEDNRDMFQVAFVRTLPNSPYHHRHTVYK